MIVSIVLGGIGLACLLFKKNVLGVLVGVQLLVLATSSAFVIAGVSSGQHVEGHLFGFFIVLSGLGQLVVGFSIAIRIFYLKNRIEMKDLTTLRG